MAKDWKPLIWLYPKEKKGKVPYKMTERLETGNTPDEFGMG